MILKIFATLLSALNEMANDFPRMNFNLIGNALQPHAHVRNGRPPKKGYMPGMHSLSANERGRTCDLQFNQIAFPQLHTSHRTWRNGARPPFAFISLSHSLTLAHSLHHSVSVNSTRMWCKVPFYACGFASMLHSSTHTAQFPITETIQMRVIPTRRAFFCFPYIFFNECIKEVPLK